MKLVQTYCLVPYPREGEFVFKFIKSKPRKGMIVVSKGEKYVVKDFARFHKGNAWMLLCESEMTSNILIKI